MSDAPPSDPYLTERIRTAIAQDARVNELGITVFMVEQNATLALSIADRGYVIQNGRIVLVDTAEQLLGNAQMRTAYLGE